jgi:hypothetical protein
MGSIASAPEAREARASTLWRVAHRARYRWPARFAGMTAAVSVRVDRRLADGGGRVRCHAVGGVTYHPGRPGHLAADLAHEVVLFAGAVLPREPDEVDGPAAARFRPDLDRPSGRAIELAGDGRRQLLWIGGERVAETELELGSGGGGGGGGGGGSGGGGHHQTWVLAGEVVDGDRWLPRLVAERSTEPDGRQRCRDVLDDWTGVGRVVAPARRRIDTLTTEGRHLVEIELHHHRLLPEGPRDG